MSDRGEAFGAIADNFAALGDDMEARYAYLLDLGRDLPSLPASHKTDAHLVPGCISRGWLVLEEKNGRVCFLADSEALIVRGILAVLAALYHDRPLSDVRALDPARAVGDLGLDAHLSLGRRNGLESVVRMVRAWLNDNSDKG